MRLVFYGGGDEEENISLNHALIKLVRSSNPVITYIPACSYDADIEFSYFARHFKKFHISRMINFPVDIPFTDILLNEVLKSDIIYLGGGNTFYFLKTLKEVGLIPKFKKYALEGGILSGLSAGAIIMTPNVKTASFPAFDCDLNEEKLKNFSSMNLVDFEFFPHYKNSIRYEDELKKYSNKINRPLYACPDGCGIILDQDKISFIGKNYCFYKGKKILLKAA